MSIDLFIMFLFIVIIYFVTYIVSFYALAVYIDPDNIESLFSNISRKRRAFLKLLASDPRALVQISIIFKTLAIVSVTTIVIFAINPSFQSIVSLDVIILLLSLIVVWLLFVVIAEYLPRRASRRAINSQMTRFLWIISLLYYLLLPVVSMYRKALRNVSMQGKVTEEEKEEIVERAIETLAEQAGIGENIVEADEKEMIGHIFLLDQTIVKEIMTPRIDLIGIEHGTSYIEIQKIVREYGYSRFPVFEETIDKITGVLYVKDLFNNSPLPGEEFVITKYLRKPFFIPETKVIGDLLREFKAKKLHIAVVVDEYGGVSGLVTLEDIIEEIVGEIQDEHDLEDEVFLKLSDGRLQVDSNLLVEDLQAHIDSDYEQGDYETIGGLIYDLVGSVPKEGTLVKWNDLEFEVYRTDGQRIKKVRIRL